ncbi:Pyruvate decarboxylase isozyme 1 [Nakaseomyces bracarensis]|uniref:Pyruvate decarboxylase isozyme 1 n=1 Tax=Nakaseomyces bracarensis TaxID=273131 RepID=A0ABR4NS01_9SACH
MSQISLGRYLFERLHQIHIDTIFGLPGDFNLALLDKIYEVEGLRWAGNANELNAAYAADGYARVKGMGCLLTTFGVGELSAVNGIAGSYAEHVGVLHVVGVPSATSQAQKQLLHHTLGNGDFDVFHRISANISETTSIVTDIAQAASEIDRCIRTCYMTQRPVYLGIPASMFDDKVSAKLLDTPINFKFPENDPDAEKEILDQITSMIKASKKPIILADACTSRHDVRSETKKLIEMTKFPAFTTPLGKGSIDENTPNFGGVYVGSLSNPEVKEFVEDADLVLSVGALLSDFNTGSFSYQLHAKNVIEFHSDHMKIRKATYPGVNMKYVLEKLLKVVPSIVENRKDTRKIPTAKYKVVTAKDNENLRQEWLWNHVGDFFQEGDIIISETGTSNFGIVESKFPNNCIGISQVLWGSIGYTLGACVGATFAAAEIDPKKRVILFIGDGSLQLTVQEISTAVRWGLAPYMFVLNNNGYTIERMIHGETAGYNDVQTWDHFLLLPAFGAKNYENIRVKTVGEWNNLIQDKAFNKNDKIRLVEIILPVMDGPDSLKKQAKLTESINAKNM